MGKKKISMNAFRRMMLGMSLVSGVMLAYEDGSFSEEEIVMLLNQLVQGLGMEANFQGMTVTPAADGGLDIHLPAEILHKLT
jgi:hypothetical protein